MAGESAPLSAHKKQGVLRMYLNTNKNMANHEE